MTLYPAFRCTLTVRIFLAIDVYKRQALRTRKRVFNENEYFCIITTCKQYQVIRFFFVKSRDKAGQAAEYSMYEVVQRWISPKGTTVTVARLRGMSILYYDLWAEYSDMEVRKNNKLLSLIHILFISMESI